jgi:hypothetical protein
MTDPTQTAGAAASSGVIVPDDLKAQHGDLIELILRSESMNDEERQYWVNILPIMTPEQIKNLRDILTNERQQLATIDAKYAKEIDQIGQKQFVEQVAAERQKRAQERSQAEESAKQAEDQHADSLLKEIEGA